MNSTVSRVLFYAPALAVRGIRLSPLVEEYRRSQSWSADALEALQADKLRRLAAHCRDRVRAFRDIEPGFLDAPGASAEAILSRMPVMDRQNYDSLVALDLPGWRRTFLASDTSSGTTGKAFRVWKNSSAWGRELAATWRAYSWFGVKVGDPQARFWGIPLSPTKRLKGRMTDIACNRLRHPDTRLEPRHFEDLSRRLARFRPRYFYGIPSLISRYARWIIESGASAPPLAGVVTTGEAIRPGQREAIEGALAARVYDEYGCGEVGSIAHQCSEGRYHIMAENLVVRVVRDGRACRPGEEGTILLTDLDNTLMPIINYDTGDVGALAGRPCGCGITLPVLDRLEGRVMDYLKTTGGKDVSPVFVYYLFAHRAIALGGVREWQLVQGGDGRVVVRIVPGPEWADGIRELISEGLRAHLGRDADLRFQMAEAIPRKPSGKVQQVIRTSGPLPDEVDGPTGSGGAP